MFDCIVVGAGPAGATAAYHLAKRGHTVLIVDQAKLPRQRACSGGVSPAIAQWFDCDLTPAINNHITKVQYTWKMGDPIEAELKMAQPMWMVRRDHFDHFLVTQAQQKGAELKDNNNVTNIARNGNNWEVTTSEGVFNSRYLIAADGPTGPTAKWLGFKTGTPTIGATLEVSAAVPQEHLDKVFFDIGSLKNGYIWNFPKQDGYSISGAFIRGKGKPEELKKQLNTYATQFGLNLNNSSYIEYPLLVWWDNHPLHTQYALLAGETAGIVDPLTGEGIRPAIFTGMQAAIAISKALTGDTSALSDYSRTIHDKWGSDMSLANKLAGLFYQFPKIAYSIGVKRPAAAQIMGKILCGELSYGDITETAIKRLKKSLVPGMGG